MNWNMDELISWPVKGEPIDKSFLNDGENESERFIFGLARAAFLGPWATANPQWNANEGNTSGPVVPKELCDLLLSFGEDSIVVSDKHITWNPKVLKELAWERWSRAALHESLNQISGASRKIKEGRPLYLDKKCRIPLHISPETKSLSGIIVAGRKLPLCDQEKDIIFRLKIEYRPGTDAPETAVDTTSGLVMVGETPTHIFDKLSLSELLKIFDTPLDFISYLKWRKDFFLRSKKVILAGNEMSLAAVYLHRKNSKNRILKATRIRPAFPLNIPPSSFSEITSSNQLKKRSKNYSASYLWDELLQRGYTSAISKKLVDDDMSELPLSKFESAIRQLGKATRDERQHLATQILLIRDGLTLDGGIFWQHSECGAIKAIPKARICFLFLEAPPKTHAHQATYAEYRDSRAAFSQLCALNILKNNPDTSSVLLLAFEGLRTQIATLGSSFDLMEVLQPEWTNERLLELANANKKSGLTFNNYMPPRRTIRPISIPAPR